MATKAFYDGPGYLDQPYQIGETQWHLEETISLIPRKAAKLRAIDGYIAYLQARRTRVQNDTETDAEKFGHQHTVLVADNVPMTTISNDPL